MNTTEKRNQIIAMLYQNMDKVDADETLKLIDELSTMAVKNNAVLPLVSGSLPYGDSVWLKAQEMKCIEFAKWFDNMIGRQ